MKVLVCGSRKWQDWKLIHHRLRQIPGTNVTLIHGAARGADTIAAKYGQMRGWNVEPHPADWDRYGKRAGIIRNRAMLDRKPRLVLAFQRDGSVGTQDAIDEAKRRGIPVEVVTV